MVFSDSTTEASENSSSEEESEKMVHSGIPVPGPARMVIPHPPPSGSESDDDSDSTTPPPKTHQQQQQRKEQQPQKQALPPSPSPSALISNKTAATKASAKRPRKEENDGIPELPSTKKKATAHTAQLSDEIPAKERKKAQKQNVSENISPTSSLQKSGKKAPQVWNSKDELAFLNGLLSFTKGGKGFPKNMSPAYDHVRSMMDIQYSNKQFRDKLRRLKTRFQSLVENMEANNYTFKNTDEATMYKLCKQLWGGEEESDDGDDEHRPNVETVGKASMNGTEKKKKKKQLPVEAEEDDREKTKCGEDQEEEEEGQEEPKRNKTVTNDPVESSGGDVERITRELYSQIREERNEMVNELKNTVVKILDESQAKKKAMIEGYFLNTRADHVQLPFSSLTTGIHSGRPVPVLNRVKAEALEEKWRKQQIVEMKAFLGRLDLLQEECEMCLEELGEPAGSGRS